MQIHVTYLPEDLDEATTPVQRRRVPLRPALSFVLTTVTLVLAAMLYLIVTTDKPIGFGAEPPPPQDPLLTLIPSLVPPAVITLLLAAALLPATARIIRRLIMFVIAVLVAAFAFGFIAFPLVDLAWRPSREQIVLVALAPWLAATVICALLVLRWRRSIRVRSWQRSPALHRPRTIDISEAGIHITDSVLELRLSWPFFKRARETQHLLLLIGEDERFYILPKRAFANDAEVERTKALIHNNVPAATFLPVQSAFPVIPTNQSSPLSRN